MSPVVTVGRTGRSGVALRTLEEKLDLSRRLAERAAAEGRTLTHAKLLDQADEMLRWAEMIRRLLEYGVGSQAPAAPPDVEESTGAAGG